MQDLVGIMQDVKTMTYEQGEQVNKIETNTYQADTNVDNGRKELDKVLQRSLRLSHSQLIQSLSLG
jgi:t-SNARE complex subunit (syntaxin)